MPDNRNELCRCGSGKKYKQCCLRLKSSPATPSVEDDVATDSRVPHRFHPEIPTILSASDFAALAVRLAASYAFQRTKDGIGLVIEPMILEGGVGYGQLVHYGKGAGRITMHVIAVTRNFLLQPPLRSDGWRDYFDDFETSATEALTQLAGHIGRTHPREPRASPITSVLSISQTCCLIQAATTQTWIAQTNVSSAG